MHQIFLIQLVASAFMTGFVWFAQIIHYPLLLKVDSGSFSEYQKENLFRSASVAIPMMCLEGVTAFWLVYSVASTSLVVNFALLVLIWISTLLLEGPTHLSLLKKFNRELVLHLIKFNWIRTILWTVRMILLLIVLVV